MAIINPDECGEGDQDQCCAVKLHKDKTVVYMAVIALIVFIVWICFDIFL